MHKALDLIPSKRFEVSVLKALRQTVLLEIIRRVTKAIERQVDIGMTRAHSVQTTRQSGSHILQFLNKRGGKELEKFPGVRGAEAVEHC